MTIQPKARANDLDRIVGARVREARRLCGLTLETLGDAVGISYQQMQKYETGTNRISAGMLCKIADAIACKPADFLADLTDRSAKPVDPRLLLISRDFARMGDHHRALLHKFAGVLANGAQ